MPVRRWNVDAVDTGSQSADHLEMWERSEHVGGDRLHPHNEGVGMRASGNEVGGGLAGNDLDAHSGLGCQGSDVIVTVTWLVTWTIRGG
nr:hypothetical protein [Rhodococcus jostii]